MLPHPNSASFDNFTVPAIEPVPDTTGMTVVLRTTASEPKRTVRFFVKYAPGFSNVSVGAGMTSLGGRFVNE